MRLFLTLCSLAALAYAKPQGGYNYGAANTGSFAAPSAQSNNFLPTSNAASTYGTPAQGSYSAGSFGASGPTQSGFSAGGYSGGPTAGGFSGGPTAGGFSGGPSAGGFSSGPTSGGFSGGPTSGGYTSGGFTGSNFGASSFQGSTSNYQQSNFEAPLVHKHFITISGPEENDNLEASKHLVIGRPQKNYRVVFIKAPSASSSNVKLSAEYAPQEEKTVIYVLTKKESALDIASDIAQPAPVVPSKPEVFFIKYKTDAEAAHAQREIQAEYDKIEGTSEHVDGGVAQQKSVVGILGDSGNGASAGVGAASNVASTASHGGFSHGGGQSSSGGVGGSYSSGSNSFTNSGVNAAKSPTYLPPSAKI